MRISLATFALISAYIGGGMSVAVGEIGKFNIIQYTF